MIDDIELIYFDLIKLITEMITPSIFNYFITNGHDRSLIYRLQISIIEWLMMMMILRALVQQRNESNIFQ